MSLPVLPTFSSQTKVILCEDDNYVQHAYQYGTTSHIDETMKPAAIIYPKNVDDIIKAVNYAREKDLLSQIILQVKFSIQKLFIFLKKIVIHRTP